jgi:hypothetical protein
MNLKQLTDTIEETGKELLGDNYYFARITCEVTVHSDGNQVRTHTATVFDQDHEAHTAICKDHTLLAAILRAKLQPSTLIEL